MTIDLDTVERALDYPYTANGVPLVQFTFADTVRQLVAELRVARDAIEDIRSALAVYDQQVQYKGIQK